MFETVMIESGIREIELVRELKREGDRERERERECVCVCWVEYRTPLCRMTIRLIACIAVHSKNFLQKLFKYEREREREIVNCTP